MTDTERNCTHVQHNEARTSKDIFKTDKDAAAVLKETQNCLKQLQIQNESLETAIKHMELEACMSGVKIKSKSKPSDACDGDVPSTKYMMLENTKLYAAVCDGDVVNTKRLVKRFKKDINLCTTTAGANLLHTAVDDGDFDIVKILLKNGADANNKCGSDVRPIHAASANGFGDIVNLLSEFGADIDSQLSDGFTPLHMAVEFSKTESIMALIDIGARVNIRTFKSRKTPLDNAIDMGNEAVIDLLSNVCQSCGGKENLFTCCCGHVKFCSETCQNKEHDFHHILCNLYSTESKNLRFKPGDRVSCMMDSEKKVYGTVIRHWYKVSDIDTDCDEPYYVPYRVKVDKDDKDSKQRDVFIYVPEDHPECIQYDECVNIIRARNNDIFGDLFSQLFKQKRRKTTHHLEQWMSCN